MTILEYAEPVTPPEEGEQRVTNLELFFDLVFVYAITQVTGMLAADPTWAGLARGLLVLGAMWWAWVAFSWLTNAIDPDEGLNRIAIFAAAAAALVAALAIPGAFGADALAFGLAYLALRVLHVVVYARAPNDHDLAAAVRRLAPSVTSACGLILLASAFDGTVQGLLWTAALLVDYAGVYLAGTSGWRVAPGHFVERHGLIVIIALGESIAAIGVGASGQRVGPELALAACLGVVLAACVWWAYFDVVQPVAERRFRRAQGDERIRIARDSYTYLHLLLVAGIVLLALGIKKTLAHEEAPLELIPAIGLCGGGTVYLAGHVAFRLRNVRSLNRQRVVAAVVLAALIPVATAVPALVALAIVAAVWVALIAYESVRFAEARARVRHPGTP